MTATIEQTSPGALVDTLEAQPIVSIGEYNFPSRSARELYGDDMLINVWWTGNPWFVAAAMFRAPMAMPFGAFWEALFVPYHEEDPDFDASKGWEQFDWSISGQSVTPSADVSLTDLGMTHKAVLTFSSK